MNNVLQYPPGYHDPGMWLRRILESNIPIHLLLLMLISFPTLTLLIANWSNLVEFAMPYHGLALTMMDTVKSVEVPTDFEST